LDLNVPTDQCCSTLKGAQCDIANGVEQPVDLGATGAKQYGQSRFAQGTLLQRFGQLPSNNSFDRQRLGFLKGAYFLQKVVERSTAVLLVYDLRSFIRLRAGVNSSGGVFWVL
jgi:hypothetical protein